MPRYKTNPLEADVQFFEQMIEKDLSGYQDIVGTVAPLGRKRLKPDQRQGLYKLMQEDAQFRQQMIAKHGLESVEQLERKQRRG